MTMKQSKYIVSFELYWDDLSENAKNYLREALKLDKDDNNNWDTFPLATIDIATSAFEEEKNG